MMRTAFVSFSMHTKSEAINNAHSKLTHNTYATQVLPKRRNVHTVHRFKYEKSVRCVRKEMNKVKEKQQCCIGTSVGFDFIPMSHAI